jgi:hypothetical protein
MKQCKQQRIEGGIGRFFAAGEVELHTNTTISTRDGVRGGPRRSAQKGIGATYLLYPDIPDCCTVFPFPHLDATQCMQIMLVSASARRWPARQRGALRSTPIEHNHTCGELELSFTVCLGSVLMCSVNEHDVADVPPCLRNPIVVSFRARTVRGHRSLPPPRWWRVLSSAVSRGVRDGWYGAWPVWGVASEFTWPGRVATGIMHQLSCM